MSDLREQLLEGFREEYREHVDGMRAVLAAPRTEDMNWEEAFRRAHSLKAAARVCDLDPLATLGQRLEALFGAARKGSLAITAEALTVVRDAVDAIENWAHIWETGEMPAEPVAVLKAVDKLLQECGMQQPAAPARVPPALAGAAGFPTPQGEGLDAEVLAAFQVEHREHLEGIRSLLTQIEATGGEPGQVDEAFRRAHSLKGAARIAGLRPAELVAHRLETLFAQAREGSLRLTPEMAQAIQRGLNFIEDAAICLVHQRPLPDPADELAAIDDALGVRSAECEVRSEETLQRSESQDTGPTTTPHAALRTSHGEEAVRVSADHLDRLLQTAEQVLTEGLTQDRSVRELALLQREAEALLREWETAGSATGVLQRLAGSPELVRVSRLLHHFGEQVRALARRARVTHRLHRQSSWALRVLGKQLQHDVRRARTVPAESIFQGFRKMMRDLARSEGKEIDFRVTGLEVKADRLVLQALKDPLMHVLRNAVCHGIEPPAERVGKGLEPLGHVVLRLEVTGSQLHVIVEDDGRGIDPRALAAEAVRRHVLTENEAASADAEELTRLVFRPGFSTARVVTDLSGRGMGLSVVQEAVTRLQGEVQITARTRNAELGVRSEESAAAPHSEFRVPSSEGTRVAIIVPLSVSAQRLLLVSCGGQKLAIPAHGVEQLWRVKPKEIETLGGQPILLLGGEPVPVRPLADLLGLAGNDEGPHDVLPVVVVRSGPRRLAIVVESLLGERDALLKDLAPPANRGDRWAGGILMEDASVCLVLNPAALFRGAEQGRVAPAVVEAAPPRPRPPEKQTKTILVVDDSLTTRTLEKSILEAHGYRVRLALDGLEALTQLRSDLPDLVITDIQMPRLDGFGLLEQMKKDPRLARLPVIVVTSLERREDQERGLALGADAYIVKRKFDHEELLQTVRQIL